MFESYYYMVFKSSDYINVKDLTTVLIHFLYFSSKIVRNSTIVQLYRYQNIMCDSNYQVID